MLRDLDRFEHSESAALRECLVDGDERQLAGLRSRRRKAFVASLTVQIILIALVIFLPLFAAGKRPLLTTITPTLRFYGVPRPTANSGGSHTPTPHFTSQVPTFTVRSAPSRVSTGSTPSEDIPPVICNLCQAGDRSGQYTGPGWPDGIRGLPSSDRATLPLPPLPIAPKPPAALHRSSMDPAMLVHRVEPEYPVLARMARREGQVQLRAVIAVDGSIQSLRVVAGDPLLIEAAKAAVLQWRYRPTILNGQAVEIDTFITVIFTLWR